MSGQEQFADRLRWYKRHQLFYYVGMVLALGGVAITFLIKQTLVSACAPFFVASAYYAWVGGEAMNLPMHANLGLHQGMGTRRFENMSPQRRRTHAKQVAFGLFVAALGAVAVDALVWFIRDPDSVIRVLGV